MFDKGELVLLLGLQATSYERRSRQQSQVQKKFKCSSVGRNPKVESSQVALSSQELAKEHPSNY